MSAARAEGTSICSDSTNVTKLTWHFTSNKLYVLSVWIDLHSSSEFKSKTNTQAHTVQINTFKEACSEMNGNYCFGWYNSGHSATFDALKWNQTIMRNIQNTISAQGLMKSLLQTCKEKYSRHDFKWFFRMYEEQNQPEYSLQEKNL